MQLFFTVSLLGLTVERVNTHCTHTLNFHLIARGQQALHGGSIEQNLVVDL